MPYDVYLFPSPPNPKDIILRPIPPIIIKHITIEDNIYTYETLYTTRTLIIQELEQTSDTTVTHKHFKIHETLATYDTITSYKEMLLHDMLQSIDIIKLHKLYIVTDHSTSADITRTLKAVTIKEHQTIEDLISIIKIKIITDHLTGTDYISLATLNLIEKAIQLVKEAHATLIGAQDVVNYPQTPKAWHTYNFLTLRQALYSACAKAVDMILNPYKKPIAYGILVKALHQIFLSGKKHEIIQYYNRLLDETLGAH